MNTQVELSEIQNLPSARRPRSRIRRIRIPYGGRDALSFVSTGVQNIAVQSNDLENLQSAAYTGGVSQGLTSALAIHVDGVYNRMTKGPMAIDVNPRSGGATGNRPLPQFGRVLQTAVDRIRELQGAARAPREAARSQLHVHGLATLAATRGNINNIGPSATITDSAHLSYDIGPNNSDRRNALVASGSFLLPASVNVGAVFSASGRRCRSARLPAWT